MVRSIALGIAVALSTVIAWAQIPRIFSYQGLLTDGSGRVVPDGDYRITVRLYDSPDATTPLYTEEHQVTAVGGVVNLLIGSIVPLPSSLQFDRVYYVGISVGGAPEVRPRIMLTAVPYSLQTQTAMSLHRARNFSLRGDVVASAVPFDGTADVALLTRVTKLQGRPVSDAVPDSGDVLRWDGGQWIPTPDASLRTVFHDSTLLGDGTQGDPLRLNLANPNTWTAPQSFSAGLSTAAFRLSTGAAAGRVLVSDNAGNGSWQPLSSLETDPIWTAAKSSNQVITGTWTFTNTINGNISGNAATATKLQTPRTFAISGDVIAPGVAFDGSNNVTLAATVTKIQNRPVSSVPPAIGSVLMWSDQGLWEPTALTSFAWSLTGNSGTIPSINFLGTTDNRPLVIKTNGVENLRINTNGTLQLMPHAAGSQQGFIFRGSDRFIHTYQAPNTDGKNTFLGIGAGNFSLSGGQTNAASYNTAVGYSTLSSLTTGNANTAMGTEALRSNTSGSGNTAVGHTALSANVTGSFNTAIGSNALPSNTASYNTAVGGYAMAYNTTGYRNTAVGYSALVQNSTGSFNVAIGVEAAFRTNGDENVAVGNAALWTNYMSSYNTAVGSAALFNSTGSQNTALGWHAGWSLSTGSNNILIGYNAQPSSSSVSNEVTLGNSSNNRYRMYAASWTNASDARYKHDIKDVPVGLDFVLALRPRRFIYNNATDGSITLGFVAQEVQAVMQRFGMTGYNLVKPFEGDYLGLNTTELIPIAVKAIQEQQRIIEQLRTENAELRAAHEQLAQQNAELLRRLERLEQLVRGGVSTPNSSVGMK